MQAPLNVYAPSEAETGLKAIGFVHFHFSLDAAVKGVAGWRGGVARRACWTCRPSGNARRRRGGGVAIPPSLSFYAQVVRRRTHRSWWGPPLPRALTPSAENSGRARQRRRRLVCEACSCDIAGAGDAPCPAQGEEPREGLPCVLNRLIPLLALLFCATYRSR